MSVKHIALALALSLSAGSLALAQTATGPVAGGNNANDSPATTGTIDAPRPGSATVVTGSNQSSTATGGTEGTDNSHRATMSHRTVHKTTAKHHVVSRKHTMGVMSTMTKGSGG